MACSFSLMLSVLESLGYGAAIVSTDGTVKATNQMADGALHDVLRACIVKGPPIRLTRGFFVAIEASAPLPAFLSLAAGRPCVVQKLTFEHDRAVFLVIIADLSTPRPTNTAVLQRGFGLTRCEARLAAALSTGSSLNEIASRRGVEIGTIRGQLKSVFIKTETKRQPELVSMLARLACFDSIEHPLQSAEPDAPGGGIGC
jgi:DNA-binding CsgD family transcriptional regulator